MEKKIFILSNAKIIFILYVQQSTNNKFRIYSRIFMDGNISSVNRRSLNLFNSGLHFVQDENNFIYPLLQEADPDPL